MFAENLRHFIIRWNDLYPIDFVWRKKYNIPFGSAEHRAVDFIDMLIDFEEAEMVKRFLNPDDYYQDDDTLPDGSKVVKLTKREVDVAFEELDVSQFNKVVETKTE